MSEESNPWSDKKDDDSVDELLGRLADALEEEGVGVEVSPSDVVNNLVSTAFTARDDTGVLGNFVLVGEIIGSDGAAHLMVVTSDNLPEWVARGMIMAADDYIAGGVFDE